MIAFVLSGGGNRGALQAGALQALLDYGIRPDILVGTSAGALNGAFIASDPTPAGAMRLTEVWERVTVQDVYPGSRWSVLWRLLCNSESLYPNDNYVRFVKRWLGTAGIQRFGDVDSGVQLYMVATNLNTGEERVFGQRPGDRILDGLMASTALPPFHPPWRCDGESYVDGALAEDLPVRVALEHGADEVFALHVTEPIRLDRPLRGMIDVTGRVVGAFLQRQMELEMMVARELSDRNLHYIPLTAYSNLTLREFGHAADMVRAGRETAQDYLETLPKPQAFSNHSWLGAVQERLGHLRTPVKSRGGIVQSGR